MDSTGTYIVYTPKYKTFNDFLAERGDLAVIERKIEGLTAGKYGYKQDLVALREFNDLVIERAYLKAIKRKIEGLTEEKLSYEKDTEAAREFIESMVRSDNPIARGIGKYTKAFAMKYGILELGYKKNCEQAFKFIKENHVPY